MKGNMKVCIFCIAKFHLLFRLLTGCFNYVKLTLHLIIIMGIYTKSY